MSVTEAGEDAGAAGVPCCDTGDILKLAYNFIFKFQSKNQPLKENEDTRVVGSGRHSGTETALWVREGTERLLYFSYRNRFIPLANGATTDHGWGCMIRAGQMMLGYALMRFFNNGNARIDGTNTEELREKAQAFFRDVPQAPFGIHAITTEGVEHGVACGKWFGPTPLAVTLSRLSATHLAAGGTGPVVLAVSDRLVGAQRVEQLLRQSAQVVLLIPVMLGLGGVSAKYARLLTRCLDMESSIGILGGRRAEAYYLYGHQGDDVFFLDPHFIKTAPTSVDDLKAQVGVRRMLLATEFDTSMALGFYISSLDSFTTFEAEMKEANAFLTFPLVSVIPNDREALNPGRNSDECTFSDNE
ncbi:AUT2/APG4/ATG4 cysteine peptidase [Trypanosoma grayi]|uniref:AUT2/APG4/ATG4 cysteine peptidase n=1 Tax=Trypanosoma grayi TaxID=71804 RepID=UPI0004F454B9|nr:AUT2/APG4/ATG4 cysteine peptidase [Trypanosoma grayi]KEG15574.1 AUT2/APG4/ATG4 cysteine peptidase [Trypanosoma grayi]